MSCVQGTTRGPEAKRLPFADADPGASGAATLLALCLGLVRDGVITTERMMEMLSSTPARLLGLDAGRVTVGAPADLILFNPDTPWQIDSDKMPGLAGNTPFDKLPVQGKVVMTMKGGRVLA
jgi:dihydroorotase